MSNPPPTEADLLRRYLLTPTLPEVVPFSKFTSLFPASVSRRHLRTLYLDLQRQRTAQLDKVAAAIDDEVRRSRDIRREMRAAARDREADEADEEIEIERAVRF